MNDWDAVLEAQRAAQQPAEFVEGRLAKEWVIPPTTVLDTRSGTWQERRRSWLAMGIESEIGRGGDVLIAQGSQDRLNDLMGNDAEGASGFKGTSIFDPVLAELAYRWWCPPGGSILDPFAGGSVRGIVAARLGHPYTGIDLSAAQVAANREQATKLLGGTSYPLPRWYVGDSLEVLPDLPAGQQFDMVFTCPPYYDLEVYSDDPKDLSAMASYGGFLDVYADIIAMAVRRLRDNRLAAVVVSNVRDKATGYYQPLERDTELAFERANAFLYNEAVLVNSVGTVALRAMNQMLASRKLGRVHQAVLCFAKGRIDSHGWDHQREAPPEPQLGFDLAAPPPAPVPMELPLPEPSEPPVYRVEADVEPPCADCDHAAHLPDTCGSPSCTCGMVEVVVPDTVPVAATVAPTADAPAEYVTWAEVGAMLAKAATTPLTVPAPDSVADGPRLGPPAPLGMTSKPPDRVVPMLEVRPATDTKADHDLCQQCGKPRGPGHQDHAPWTTPTHAAELYEAGVWDKADATPEDEAAMQGANLWDGLA